MRKRPEVVTFEGCKMKEEDSRRTRGRRVVFWPVDEVVVGKGWRRSKARRTEGEESEEFGERRRSKR